MDKNSKLSNGDKITLTASYSQQTTDYLNINIEEPTRTFKVKGLTPILKSYSNIDKDIRKKNDRFCYKRNNI